MKEVLFRLPEAAAQVIGRLNAQGYEAYAVGGCVRDTLLGREPKDWDICTSAEPAEVERAFSDMPSSRIVETGLQHGTVTVVVDHVPYEVTTYRADGVYTDHRHPDSVRFVRSLKEDLARRDFTINAMAYHPEEGLKDFFGGREDLEARVIRCVGAAEKRFDEDALRILRALRFASVYAFNIEEETDRAIRLLYETLSHVASERIWQEVQKLLCGQGVREILMGYPEVICSIFPELEASVGFLQHNPYHHFTVYEHLARSVAEVPPETVLRLTMLFHDAGKPKAFTVDERGIGHAYGHAEISVKLVASAMERMRVDNRTRDRVLVLVRDHDLPLEENEKMLRRRLAAYGEETLMQLMEVQRADALSKGTFDREHVERAHALRLQKLQELVAQHPCVTLRDLAVNGRDLIDHGIPAGKTVGHVLTALLDRVIAGDLPNEREALLKTASQLTCKGEKNT